MDEPFPSQLVGQSFIFRGLLAKKEGLTLYTISRISYFLLLLATTASHITALNMNTKYEK